MHDPILNGLRFGCVPYLNARPLVFGIEDNVTFEVPASLSDRFGSGGYDVALLPVYEAFRQPAAAIVDGVSISCLGAVQSVILVHREPLEEITSIVLDPASRTSANLLRILLAERFQLAPRLIDLQKQSTGGTELGGAVSSAENRGMGILPMLDEPRLGKMPMPLSGDSARLIIGDPLAFQSQHSSEWHILDLGQAWYEWTGLPFVFAAWTLREGLDPNIAAALRNVAADGMAHRKEIAAGDRNPNGALHYLTHHIRYGLADQEKLALNRFRQLLENNDLLDSGGKSASFV